ncbi:glycosyltransferase [Trichocoleus sp. DQ-A3]|nr:glycosyltransferase [Coleofasciculus sp. FACHB-125]
MYKLPSISIIVPSFNQGKYLGQTLESIFCQGYPRLEVIVMDGGSTDESLNIIHSYEPKLTYWQSQPDGGQSEAINLGMQHCTGELVTWLNSDDFYWGDSLWSAGRAYAAFPEHGLYIGNGLRYNQSSESYTPFCRRHLALNREALMQGLDYILQPSVFFWRRAWDEVGGLDSKLCFCMDWDILIRIAKCYPAVLINEFLAVSREYEETKTRSGKLSRAFEIAHMIQFHTQQEATPGSLFYMLETLVSVTNNCATSATTQLRHHLLEGMNAIRQQLAQQCGNDDGFPEQSDPQDKVYLPFATAITPQHLPQLDFSTLPLISIIIPSFNQAQFLSQTLESILCQGYPKLEILVFDGGSTDGSVDVILRYQQQLTYWISEPDRGPAHAINKGFAMATGEILAWLNSDDMLASDALWQVGRAFVEDPELDMVFANALYIDEENKLYLANHGSRTGLYYGEVQPLNRIPAYWSYVHAVPQPTVFFRNRLLKSCGYLNETYHYIFDFELFWRFAWKAKIKKIERTQAFYRIHAASKTSDWNKFLVELYRFSRPWWPSLRSTEFRSTFRDFVSSYMSRKYENYPRDARFWAIATLVGLSTVTRVGNPEELEQWLPIVALRRLKPQTPTSPQPPTVKLDAHANLIPVSSAYRIYRKNIRYSSVFCSFFLPCHPGYSGGEIRDFHLIRHLLTVSKIEFFALQENLFSDRENILAPFLEKLHTPQTIAAQQPDLVDIKALQRTIKSRIVSQMRCRNLPVLGPHFHGDIAQTLSVISAYLKGAIQETIEREQPDFLFVSPQVNSVALTLKTAGLRTRFIMASYDVEAVRMQRLAASQRGIAKVALSLEARRALCFEQENLCAYDGVIAVSELDKNIFVAKYGFAPERVLVIENGVDPHYFAFTERQGSDKPHIMFVGSLAYLPNQQAAWRLLHRIMPLVRQRYPEACLWIVGQSPEPALLAQSDGHKTVVTGKVDDVRSYLALASVACVPLLSGSGTKYKVLEALSAGVPMVCSPIAQEGLNLEDEKHLLVGHSDEELAAAIVRLLDNPELANTLAQQGREVVERYYTWDSNLPRLTDWLDVLASLPKRSSGSIFAKK